MINTTDKFYKAKKARLSEQVKFFGSKRFISVYANKPHIKVKAKPEFDYRSAIDEGNRLLQTNIGMSSQHPLEMLRNMGMQHSSLGMQQGIATANALRANQVLRQQNMVANALGHHDYITNGLLTGLKG